MEFILILVDCLFESRAEENASSLGANWGDKNARWPPPILLPEAFAYNAEPSGTLLSLPLGLVIQVKSRYLVLRLRFGELEA